MGASRRIFSKCSFGPILFSPIFIGTVGLFCLLVSGAKFATAGDDAADDTAPLTAASSLLVSDTQVRTASASTTTSLVDDPACPQCESCDAYCNQPAWIVSAGAVFLHRSRPTPAPIVTPSTGPGSIVNGSDFGFNWNSGPIISIARRTRSGYILEGRYFGDHSATATDSIGSINTFRMAGIGVTILGGGSLAASYNTQLDSTEFNVHKPITDRFTWLNGFRCVEVHDRLNVNLVNAINTTWNDNNRLYGAQTGVGMNFVEAGRPLQFNGSLKAGLYGNTAYNQFTSGIVAGTNSSATTAAFVGEANFTGSYQITQRLSLSGGYMVLWVNSLALADQAAAGTTQIAGGTHSPTPTSGALWYNGAIASINYVW